MREAKALGEVTEVNAAGCRLTDVAGDLGEDVCHAGCLLDLCPFYEREREASEVYSRKIPAHLSPSCRSFDTFESDSIDIGFECFW